MKAFYVKVVSSQRSTYWYNKKIGACFWAEKHPNFREDGFTYKVIHEGHVIDSAGAYLEGCDVEILKEAEVDIVTMVQVIEK